MVEVTENKTGAALSMPEGFKQTEVGMIPEDWEVSHICDFCELTSSKRIFEYDYVPFGIPFYRGKEISLLLENKPITKPHYIAKEKFLNLKRNFGAPAKNDILITAVGTLGNVYLIPSNNDFYFKDGNLIWLRKIQGIDHRFFAIQIANFRKEIVDNAIGSSQKALTIVVLRKQPIPLPPTLTEQTAIATALSDMDALIEAQEALLVKKRALKQGAMQELLTGKRWLVETDGTSWQQTEVGRIPGDWEVKKLGEVGEVRMCKRIFNHQTKEQGEIPFYKIGTFGKEPDAYITKKLFDDYVRKYSYPNVGDILISASGTIGKTVIFDGKPAYFQDSNIIWIDNQEKLVSNRFLYHIYQVAKYGTEGGTIQRLYNDIIKSTKFICPSKSEQTAIATALSDMDAEIEQLEAQLTKYRQLKRGMMQELLTGRKRLI